MLANIKAFHDNAADQCAYLMGRYYREQESGYWLGTGAQYLGLRGDVRENEFIGLLEGRSPFGEQLVRRFREREVTLPNGSTRIFKNTNSFDMVFSHDKPVSIAMCLASTADRQRFEACGRKAVQDVVRFLEDNLCLGRRGKGGTQKVKVKLCASAFTHHMNRQQGEPHVHTHLVISNVALGADGRWSKLDSNTIHKWTPTLGRIARASFAREVAREFGLQLYEASDRPGQIKSALVDKAVPKELCDSLSTARKKLLEHAGEAGDGRGTEAARARCAAHYATRNPKDPNLSFAEVQEAVRNAANEHGVSYQQIEEQCHRFEPSSQKTLDEAYGPALSSAIERVASDRAHFTEREIVEAVLDSLQHLGIEGGKTAERVISDLPHSPELVQLHDKAGERHFATKQQFELEANLLSRVKSLTEREGAQVKSVALTRRLARNANLSAEQRSALKIAVRGPGAIREITGEAGSGKSTLLTVVKQAFEQQGYRVVGTAIAGATARDLEAKTGIETRTVASHLHSLQRTPLQRTGEELLHDTRMVARSIAEKPTWKLPERDLSARDVLVVEEAGMLSTRDLEQIVSRVEVAGATLLLVGDSEQLPAIGPGAPLEHLTQIVPAHAHLQTNYRQLDSQDAKVVKDIRDGRIDEALQNLDERERIEVCSSSDAAARELVARWKQEGGLTEPSKHVILTQTRADAAKLNRLCQAARLEAGATTEKRAVLVQGERFLPGDRVLFHEALKATGIENGHFGSVIRTNPRSKELVIQLERPRTKLERASGLKQVVTLRETDLKKGQLTLGSAATTHKLQGATVENAYVLISGPMTNKEMAYVQLSRARGKTRLFVSRSIAGEKLENLGRLLKRSRKNALAHEMSLNAQ